MSNIRKPQTLEYQRGYEDAKKIYERKKGEWIKVNPYIVICPFCNHASSQKNFCAECGADMREKEE